MSFPAAIERQPRRWPAWLAWSRKDQVFVALSCATVVAGYWALSGSRDGASFFAVLVATSLAMHARLAVGAAPGIAIVLASTAGVAALGIAPRLAITMVCVGMTGLLVIAWYGGRARLLRIGAGLAVLAIAITLGALFSGKAVPGAAVVWETVAMAGGGFGSVLLMLALDPVLDALFGHATRLTLSEWLSFEHPLLRELSAAAPGTLQHSVNVGVLAAAAATAIRADALLARVGGLYHDVGKAAAPEYFIENQHGRNPHDLLDPFESARVIRAHVADGVTRVVAHGMGDRIADFVKQHHGTSLIGFLRTKASERAGAPVPEDEFRYPGPRPQSKEAGILMLADQVEATARSAPPADLAACEAIVRTTIARTQAEGQLGESGLMARDVAAIEAALVRTVHAMYHRRLVYPARGSRANPTIAHR